MLFNFRYKLMKNKLTQFASRSRLFLAAKIAGGNVHQFEGRKRDGSWVKGPIILTPAGIDAMRAAFRHDASVFVDTSLRDLPSA